MKTRLANNFFLYYGAMVLLHQILLKALKLNFIGIFSTITAGKIHSVNIMESHYTIVKPAYYLDVGVILHSNN